MQLQRQRRMQARTDSFRQDSMSLCPHCAGIQRLRRKCVPPCLRRKRFIDFFLARADRLP